MNDQPIPIRVIQKWCISIGLIATLIGELRIIPEVFSAPNPPEFGPLTLLGLKYSLSTCAIGGVAAGICAAVARYRTR